MDNDKGLDAWEAAGANLAVFLMVMFTGLFYGLLVIMLISMGGWPWLLWLCFGVKLSGTIITCLSARKKAMTKV